MFKLKPQRLISIQNLNKIPWNIRGDDPRTVTDPATNRILREGRKDKTAEVRRVINSRHISRSGMNIRSVGKIRIFSDARQHVSLNNFSRIRAYLPVFLERRLTWCIMLAIIYGLHFVPNRIWDKLRDKFIAAPWVVKLVAFVIIIQLVLQFASATVQPFLYSQF